MVRYVVVGGGVAGVCCAEELCQLCSEDSVTLVSLDRVLKGVSTVAKITRTIEELQVVEKDLSELSYPNFQWVQGTALGLDPEKRLLHIAGKAEPVPYDKLCICTGAQPRRLLDSPDVLVVRDIDSVVDLASKVESAKNVVVVGNGGIALELADALRCVNITWVVRHGHIGDAFFDIDAAHFLLEQLQRNRSTAQPGSRMNKSVVASASSSEGGSTRVAQQHSLEKMTTSSQKRNAHAVAGHLGHIPMGHSAGPAWCALLPSGDRGGSLSSGSVLTIEYSMEVAEIRRLRDPSRDAGSDEGCEAASVLEVSLSDGRKIHADIVISAIGVDPGPAVAWVPESISRGPDGGLSVDRCLQTSARGVYAAGDACCACWGAETPPHWFQMRLWSQARAMGVYAAHCMAGIGGDRGADMAFELFTHVTRFLGKKIVLLGLYNGQRLEAESEEDMVTYSRVTEDDQDRRSFVRVLLSRGRVQGAVMIGETDLEETIENLILDGLDVSRYGPDLLDPDAELDHIFD